MRVRQTGRLGSGKADGLMTSTSSGALSAWPHSERGLSGIESAAAGARPYPLYGQAFIFPRAPQRTFELTGRHAPASFVPRPQMGRDQLRVSH